MEKELNRCARNFWWQWTMEAQRQALPLENSCLQVELAVGLPPKHYGALYEKFEKYFKNRGKQQILYRGKTYELKGTDTGP